MTNTQEPIDPRMTAGVDLLRRTGTTEVQIRYQDDQEPTVWVAIGKWGDNWETAAGPNPTRAVLRLCERVVDGGQCTHCHRPTAFEGDDIGTQILERAFCWYMFDPELKTFRRGCE